MHIWFPEQMSSLSLALWYDYSSLSYKLAPMRSYVNMWKCILWFRWIQLSVHDLLVWPLLFFWHCCWNLSIFLVHFFIFLVNLLGSWMPFHLENYNHHTPFWTLSNCASWINQHAQHFVNCQIPACSCVAVLHLGLIIWWLILLTLLPLILLWLTVLHRYHYWHNCITQLLIRWNANV